MKCVHGLLCLILMICFFASAIADINGIPMEVETHISENWPHHQLFDYLCVEDTSKGDYGIALLSREKEKLLAVYRNEDGVMSYQYKNAAAIPQGEGYSYAQYQENPDVLDGEVVFLLSPLSEHDVKNIAENSNRIIEYGDDLGFSVLKWDTSNKEFNSFHQTVTYHWEDGNFKLSEYRNDDIWFGPVFVSEQKLDYYRGEWEYAGTAYGDFQRDLQHASLSAMPKTLDEAREKLSLPPEIPTGYSSDLTAEKIKFTGGKKYAVYTGPGEDYVRSGNGKGSVSTNDWIQVFGEENGWIMIQYDISSDRFRIGWIEAKALPKNASVRELCYEPVYAYLTDDVNLTDDPLNSQTQIVMIEEGTAALWLATMGDWAYIEVDGSSPMRGFVKAEILNTQVFDATEAAKNLLTEVYGYTREEAEYGFDYQTIHQGSSVLLVYSPKEHPEWAYTLMMNKATGETSERTTPFATEYEGYPGEGTVRFELSKKNFASEEEVVAFFESCYGPQSGWSAALHGWCAEEMSKAAHYN